MRILTQVLDGTYGKPAAGVRARLSRTDSNDGWVTVGEASTNDDGRIDEWDSWHLERGLYRIAFDSDGHFAKLGTNTAYPEVIVIFRMQDENHDFQIQVTFSPYSYHTYFGILENIPEKPGWERRR
jgi:5-hydroxyisourate hydrolase